MQHDDDTAKVDWSEAEGLEVLARTTVTIPVIGGGPRQQETTEQVLCKTATGLLLFTRRRRGSRQTLERTEVGGELDRSEALIQRFPAGIYMLQLQPADGRSIHWAVSKGTKKGRWKSERTSEAPIYCTVESADLEALHELRIRLIGPEAHERMLPLDAAVSSQIAENLKPKTLEEAFEEALKTVQAECGELPKEGEEWIQVVRGMIDKLKRLPGDNAQQLVAVELPSDVERYWTTFEAYSLVASSFTPAAAGAIYMHRSYCEMLLEEELKRLKKQDKELHKSVHALLAPINMSVTYRMKGKGRK